MQIRYSTALGFLASASLLGGSAFAFAPEFVGDLPTVIITDKMSAAAPNDFDPGTNATQFLFRYPDAFDLSSSAYVSPGPSALLSDVRFLFNEFRDVNKDGVADSLSPELPAARTLLIQTSNGNDHLSFATVGTPFPLGSTEFASAPQVGLLDFRNIDFSPAADYESTSGLPFDATGDVTGHNLLVSGSQFRVVQLYLNTNFATQAPDVANMLVVTEMGTADRLTTGVPGLSDPFTSIQPTTNDFQNWELGGSGLLGSLPQAAGGSSLIQVPAGGNPGTFTGFSTVPVRDFPTANGATADPFDTIAGVNRFAVAGTTSLTTNATTAARGYVRWAKAAPAASIAANQLLRFRARLESADGSANSKDWFLLGFGSLKTGLSNTVYFPDTARTFSSLIDGVAAPESKLYNPPAAPGADFDAYLIAEAAETAALGLNLDVLGLDNPTATPPQLTGNDIKITAYSVAAAPAGRSYLTGKNVLLNRGNPTVPTPIVGEILSPESGATGFTFGTGSAANITGGTAAGHTSGVNGTGNSSIDAATAMTGTANALSYTLTAASVPSGSTTAYPDYRAFSFYTDVLGNWLDLENPTGGHFRALNDKLYILDVWASTTTTASNNFPQFRINTTIGGFDAEYTVYVVNPTFVLGLNAGTEIQSAPRAYSSVNRAQLGPANTASVPATLGVEFQQPLIATTMTDNTNITIHRITVTEYNTP